MKILTVTGYKGGVGKSTTALHLAGFFSELGKSMLVDGDPNRTALEWAKNGKLPFEVIIPMSVARSARECDWLIFDTPARPEDGDLSAMPKNCDLLILPTEPNIVSIRPMLATIKALGATNYKVLLTDVDSRRSKRARLIQGELRDMGYPVFDTMVRSSAHFEAAAEIGALVRDMKGNGVKAAWGDYYALGCEVMEILKNE